MKSLGILITSLMIFPFISSAQIFKEIDQITPFHEELAAIRKGEQWAFINTKGEVVIDYRDDLVWTSQYDPKNKTKKVLKEATEYPIFSDGRCLIKHMKNGIYYYGYIDQSGKTVIEPEYLNAVPFYKGHAIVLKISKEDLGENKLLNKKVVSYSYDEVVIDPSGSIKIYLRGPKHLILTKDKMRWRPNIKSYLMSSNLAVVRGKDSWEIRALHALSN